MSSGVEYRETLRMQRSTFVELAGIFVLSAAPLALVAWLLWRPLGAGLVAVGVAGLLATFRLARWQLAVRDDGLYYRVLPFLPIWRPLASAEETVDVVVEAANGRRTLDEEGKLFPWSAGTRVVAIDVDGGIRIQRADGTQVFVSSRSPDEFASALRSVAR